MDLARYVENLRQHLRVAAEAGGVETQMVGEQLAAALEPATRLALLDALSTAADEITTELAPGSVEVRLRGTDVAFVVTSPVPPETSSGVNPPQFDAVPPGFAPLGTDAPEADEGGTARITLRLPEQLKAQVEQAAARDGISVNAWLVRATTSAVQSRPAGTPPPARTNKGGQHLTGWAR